MGYSHFVIKYDQDKCEYCVSKRIVTYEAIRSSKKAMPGSIEQIMHFPENETVQYYVMFSNPSKQAKDLSCRSLVLYEAMTQESRAVFTSSLSVGQYIKTITPNNSSFTSKDKNEN